jgi:hypothetical protein
MNEMALTEPQLIQKSVKSHDTESQFVRQCETILQKIANCFQNFSQYSFVVHPSKVSLILFTGLC